MKLHSYQTRDSASEAAARFVSESLQAVSGAQNMLVSGGSSPKCCFQFVSKTAIDWFGVTISLTDERLVAPDHEASNERMVRETLLTNRAAVASFVTPQQVAPHTFANDLTCALVGMGTDGHFASIFPDCANIDQLLDQTAPPAFIEVETVASPYRRISANLSLILKAKQIVLLVFGQDKKDVLAHPHQLPIEHLISQTHSPVQIFWAP